MDIKECIAILEEHADDIRRSKSDPDDFTRLIEALDFAIDSLKAVDESLN